MRKPTKILTLGTILGNGVLIEFFPSIYTDSIYSAFCMKKIRKAEVKNLPERDNL